jgi:peroxiredoxin
MRASRNCLLLVFCLASVDARSAQAFDDPVVAITESVDITGRAIDEDGRPVAGATVYLASTNPIQAPEPLLAKTTTAADGFYEFRQVTLPVLQSQPAPEARFEVYGTALGYGFTWQGARIYRPIQVPAQAAPEERGRTFYKDEPIVTELTFGLPATLHGHIIDDFGKPLAGARVELGVVQSERTGRPGWLCSFLESSPRRLHRDDRTFAAMWLLPISYCTTETDADGNFVITGLPREAGMIGRIAYKPGFEEKTFQLATTTTQQPRMECVGYQGVLNHTFKAPRLVRVRVIHADSKLPASCTHVRVRADRIMRHGGEGNTDHEGMLELRLTPSRYVLIAETRWHDPYIKSEQPITVEDEPFEQSVVHALTPGVSLVLTAIDTANQKPIAGVDFLVGSDHSPERSTLQSQTVFVDNPTTDEKGQLRAILAAGTYQFVVNTVPPGYEAVRKTSDPCELIVGKVENVRFEFRRIDSLPTSPAVESPIPPALAEKWRQQSDLLDNGRATISIHRRPDSWIEKDRLEAILGSFDSDKVPDLEDAVRREYPDKDFAFGEMEILCDGLKHRQASSYVESGERRDSGVIAINGKEAVERSAFNAQADVFSLREFRRGTVSLRDLCLWPRISTRLGKKEGEEPPGVAIERFDGRIKLNLQPDTQQNKTTKRIIADEQTGFVYFSSSERVADGEQTWQFAPQKFANGAIVPGLKVEFTYRDGRVTRMIVYRVQRLEVGVQFPLDAFVVPAPAGTNVVDHRGGDVRNPKSAVAYEPITDLVTFGNSIPTERRARSEVVKPGDTAPAVKPALWLSQDGQTTAHDLSGKILLVDFWGIGCGACVTQLPEVQAAAERYAGRGVLVIGLHESSETVEAVSGFARKHGLTYPLAIDSAGPSNYYGATFAAYGVRAIPQAAVIDCEGRIAHIGDWKEVLMKVDELLKQNPD